MQHANTIKTKVLTILTLTLSFTALKLTHHISWSWWWVISPIWLAAVILAFVAIPFLFLLYIYRKERKGKYVLSQSWMN